MLGDTLFCSTILMVCQSGCREKYFEPPGYGFPLLKIKTMSTRMILSKYCTKPIHGIVQFYFKMAWVP